MQRTHLARDCRLHPPGHRRPAGHSYQRDRVQHHPLLEGNERQYRFLYDIQQHNVDDHSNVILSLMARSMVDGATSSLTLAIGPPPVPACSPPRTIRCSASLTPGHCWHPPRPCHYVPTVVSSRSDCPSPSSNMACGRTTARAARRPVATSAILAEPRNASAAVGSPANTTPQ